MSKKTLFLSILFLASLTLVVSGCIKKPQPPVNTNQPVNVNQDTNTATSTTEIDTSDWKTYRNEEYGFEFKYPPYLKVSLDDSRGMAIRLQNEKSGLVQFYASNFPFGDPSISEQEFKKSFVFFDGGFYLRNLLLKQDIFEVITKSWKKF